MIRAGAQVPGLSQIQFYNAGAAVRIHDLKMPLDGAHLPSLPRSTLTNKAYADGRPQTLGGQGLCPLHCFILCTTTMSSTEYVLIVLNK